MFSVPRTIWQVVTSHASRKEGKYIFNTYNILTYLLRYDPHGSYVKAAARI